MVVKGTTQVDTQSQFYVVHFQYTLSNTSFNTITNTIFPTLRLGAHTTCFAYHKVRHHSPTHSLADTNYHLTYLLYLSNRLLFCMSFQCVFVARTNNGSQLAFLRMPVVVHDE